MKFTVEEKRVREFELVLMEAEPHRDPNSIMGMAQMQGLTTRGYRVAKVEDLANVLIANDALYQQVMTLVNVAKGVKP